MSTVKNILNKKDVKARIKEFLKRRLKDAIFGDVDIAFTPLGVRITVYTMRPGRLIGTRGRTIKEITRKIEEEFKVENPQISVAEIEVPELNPDVMAQRIAQALERGTRHRRVAFWAIDRIMSAGAKGVEIEISGKLTSARARTEKYTSGFIPKVGDVAMKYLRIGKASVQLKPGIFGIKVKIYPPNAPSPEDIQVSQVQKEVIESGERGVRAKEAVEREVTEGTGGA